MDLDHVDVHLNTILAPDVDLLHLCLVEIAGYRALAQMVNQVGSLACLVFVMVDTSTVAASTAALVENGIQLYETMHKWVLTVFLKYW